MLTGLDVQDVKKMCAVWLFLKYLCITGVIVGVNQIFACRAGDSLFYPDAVRIIFVAGRRAVDSNRLEAVLEVIFVSYGLDDIVRVGGLDGGFGSDRAVFVVRVLDCSVAAVPVGGRKTAIEGVGTGKGFEADRAYQHDISEQYGQAPAPKAALRVINLSKSKRKNGK